MRADPDHSLPVIQHSTAHHSTAQHTMSNEQSKLGTTDRNKAKPTQNAAQHPTHTQAKKMKGTGFFRVSAKNAWNLALDLSLSKVCRHVWY
jgi:hypothetical protein